MMISKVTFTAVVVLSSILFATTASEANDPLMLKGQIKVQSAQPSQSIYTALDEKWSSDDIVALDGELEASAPSFMTQPFPRLEVRTNKDYVKVIAELPGIKQGDLELVANSDILCLTGTRQAPHGERVIVSELPCGAFKRRVRLPHPIKVEQAVACLQDGILTVTMPRWQNAESPKRISISTNERRYESCVSQNCNRF